MTKVGLLSDTHGYWDEKYLQYFEGCDEIWHAGDIGSLEVAQKLAAFRPFRAVYGKFDGQEIRQLYPQILRFTVDGAEVLMKHNAGYPGNYDNSIKGSNLVSPTKLYLCGHSHILKVKYISLVNLIANREVVKELVADTMTVEQVRSELNRNLYEKEYRRQMLEGYEYMASCQGEAGAPKHAAREMVALLRRREE